MASTHAITPAQAPILLMDVLKANLVPMIQSSPGLGKSTIARTIAAENNLKVIDLRLSQCDPTDLGGFPMINDEKTKAGYVPMNTFPIEGDPLPEKADGGKYNGWLLLLDEFNSAPQSVQAAAYKVVLDKEVGLHKLHEKVAIICAGNLVSDKAIVNKLGTAMQSRLIHFEMMPDHDDWFKWAAKANIDYRITSFIAFRPELLHAFDPNHNDKTFPCPRTWEFLSKMIHTWDRISAEKGPLIAGTIGEGPAMEFTTYCDIFEKLPSIEKILKSPTKVNIGDEPSVMYAISGLVSKHFKSKNAETLMKLINRLPLEFQIICLRGAIAQDTQLTFIPSVQKWIKDNAEDLL